MTVLVSYQHQLCKCLPRTKIHRGNVTLLLSISATLHDETILQRYLEVPVTDFTSLTCLTQISCKELPIRSDWLRGTYPIEIIHIYFVPVSIMDAIFDEGFSRRYIRSKRKQEMNLPIDNLQGNKVVFFIVTSVIKE